MNFVSVSSIATIDVLLFKTQITRIFSFGGLVSYF